MNISLTPDLEAFIHEKVKSGLYTSNSEVVRESLRIMHTYEDIQKQRINQLNQAIEVGMQQLDSGQKIKANDSYKRLKDKIDTASKEEK